MKRADDPRHIKREQRMQQLFADSFGPDKPPAEISPIREKISDIDILIEQAAPQFPITKIAKVDVAILRLAIFELLFEKKEPPKVIIDEAVELAKEYGGEGSPGFINGVLGHILNNRDKEDKKDL